MAMMKPLTFADLSEELPDEEVPYLDKQDIDESKLTPEQLQWRRKGFIILENLIPQTLNDAYCNLRQQFRTHDGKLNPWGWHCHVPYMYYKEIRDICLYPPLMEVMRNLFGESVGLHLNLTGWISTQRDWHQDDYLTPDHVLGHYCAVWMALDDIHPDAGPFQYVPGSNRWPAVRRHKVFEHLTPEEQSKPSWPFDTQEVVAKAYEDEILRRDAEVKSFLGKKNDVLIWHSRLLHRGPVPNNPQLMRKAIISHYSPLSNRTDMLAEKPTLSTMSL
jgi:Phytanoyl-CoA dioxygenase (PhyH)